MANLSLTASLDLQKRFEALYSFSITNLILALKIFLSLATLFFAGFAVREMLHLGLVSTLENSSPEDLSASENNTASKYQNSDYQLIVTRNVFGELNQPQNNNKTAVKPLSVLPLDLIGTVLSDGLGGYAIIENKKKAEQDAFSIGDSIFGDATLKSISHDRIEIERNGQIEILEVDDSKSSKGAPIEGGVANLEGDEFVVDEKELDSALENLPLLLSQARAIPYFQDGKSVGLRLFAIRSGSLYEKVGLKNGDILRSINGQSLADPTQALKLFEQLKEERSISVNLERNREPREFKYQIR